MYEEELLKIVDEYCKKSNLILSGGCGLNCLANSKIKNKNIWIILNSGDSGSALGCIFMSLKRNLIGKVFLGTNIEGEYY